MTPDIQRSAVLSDDGLYRYRLDRWWGDGPRIAWVMLNPSTADALADDPTIRRVVRFSRDWGYDGCVVLNVYAWRATKPADLPLNDEVAAGPEWGRYFGEIIEAMPVVAAWGAYRSLACADLGRILRKRKALFPTLVLGLTKDGHPKHPLYIPAATEPQEWTGQ